VLDCQARTYEAERCWHEALGVYDGMSAETFAVARASGRADILDKLERLAASRQKAAEEGIGEPNEGGKPATRAGRFGRRKEA
jgi:hypothetical protein